MMAAWLQGYIHRPSLRRFRAGTQRIPLRMEPSIRFMPALPDHPSIFDNDRPHHRIRRRPSGSSLSQLQRQPHILQIIHFPTSKENKKP